MGVRSVSPEQVREGTKCGERADRDDDLHIDLRSQVERSAGAPREIDVYRVSAGATSLNAGITSRP